MDGERIVCNVYRYLVVTDNPGVRDIISEFVKKDAYELALHQGNHLIWLQLDNFPVYVSSFYSRNMNLNEDIISRIARRENVLHYIDKDDDSNDYYVAVYRLGDESELVLTKIIMTEDGGYKVVRIKKAHDYYPSLSPIIDITIWTNCGRDVFGNSIPEDDLAWCFRAVLWLLYDGMGEPGIMVSLREMPGQKWTSFQVVQTWPCKENGIHGPCITVSLDNDSTEEHPSLCRNLIVVTNEKLRDVMTEWIMKDCPLEIVRGKGLIEGAMNEPTWVSFYPPEHDAWTVYFATVVVTLSSTTLDKEIALYFSFKDRPAGEIIVARDGESLKGLVLTRIEHILSSMSDGYFYDSVVRTVIHGTTAAMIEEAGAHVQVINQIAQELKVLPATDESVITRQLLWLLSQDSITCPVIPLDVATRHMDENWGKEKGSVLQHTDGE